MVHTYKHTHLYIKPSEFIQHCSYYLYTRLTLDSTTQVGVRLWGKLLLHLSKGTEHLQLVIQRWNDMGFFLSSLACQLVAGQIGNHFVGIIKVRLPSLSKDTIYEQLSLALIFSFFQAFFKTSLSSFLSQIRENCLTAILDWGLAPHMQLFSAS